MTDNINNHRKPLLAFLFSIFTPGLGHIYNGRLITGVILFSVCQLFSFFFYLTHISGSFYGLFLFLLIAVCFGIYIIGSAIYISVHEKDYTPKPYNKPIIMVLIAVIMLLISFIINDLSIIDFNTYRIASSSGEPTLHIHDMVVADITCYKRNPIQYGDIVVFKSYKGDYWISRVVGLPFDTIGVVDDVVSINHKICSSAFVKDNTSDGYAVKEFEEVLPNGHRHKIFKFIKHLNHALNTVSDTVIPANHYYLLGDNRDNAADSRVHGFVKKEDITGRIIYSYWGQTKDRINIDFKDK
jgi:signal peptidase I